MTDALTSAAARKCVPGVVVLGVRMCPDFGKIVRADAFGLERLLTGRTAFLDRHLGERTAWAFRVPGLLRL